MIPICVWEDDNLVHVLHMAQQTVIHMLNLYGIFYREIVPTNLKYKLSQ
jgi:hypothetical protein